MFRNFNLSAIFKSFGLRTKQGQSEQQEKLQKPPPPSKILDELKARGLLKKSHTGMRFTLVSTVDEPKAKLGKHGERTRHTTKTTYTPPSDLEEPLIVPASLIAPASLVYKVIVDEPPCSPKGWMSILPDDSQAKCDVDFPPDPIETDISPSEQEFEQKFVVCVSSLVDLADVSDIPYKSDVDDTSPEQPYSEEKFKEADFIEQSEDDEHYCPHHKDTPDTQMQTANAITPVKNPSLADVRCDSPFAIKTACAGDFEDEVDSDSDNSAASSTKTSSIDRTSDMSEREADQEEEPTRADWEPLRAISHLRFVHLLASRITSSTPLDEDDFEFVSQHEGNYNHVRIYKLPSGDRAGTYVIKIPSVGTAAHWQPQDAYMFRSEIGTMKLIRERTKCPVPEVLAYDDTLINELGAPFVIMKACTGVQANEIWYEKDADGDIDLDKADYPSPSHAEKRKRFLRSLAHAMAELRILEFDGIVVKECPINALEGPNIVQTTHYLLDTLCRMNPFSSSKKPQDDKETFVLRHDDLNLQNIFCDPTTGEVTCIIDWQQAFAAPRCIGYASLPVFLMTDWDPEYLFFADIHTPWVLDSYRKIYADAMIEATGSEGDGKYTEKSAMYQATFLSLYTGHGEGTVVDFVKKLLRSVECLSCVDVDEFRSWMGDGNIVPGIEMLKKHLPQVVEP